MDVLLNPDKFFMEHKEMSFKLPIAIVAISAIVSATSAYSASQIIFKTLPIESGGLNLLPLFSAFAAISAFLGAFLFWVVFAVILYAISAIFKGKGNFTTLMKFLAFSFIPSIILSPIYLYLNAELLGSPTMENLYAIVIFSAVVALWQFVYFVFAVKNARELSVKKSAIVCAIPLVLWFAYSIYSLQNQLEVLQMLKSLQI
ncbi:MAG: YIP1 family protein [Archaeoglobaceae archaeon]